jgi:alkylhydroperoxidase family enzyme
VPKIPYVPADMREPADIVTAVRARRGGDLLHLDRMLLHSPPFALGWNSLLGAVRSELALPPRLRELAICAVGALNGAEYEIQQHAGPFREAGGTDRQLEALRDCGRAARDATLFNQAEQAVLHLTMAMTRDVQVSPELMAATRAALGNDRELVELVGVIATYNMVSRFLVALGIEPEEETEWTR